MRVAGLDIGSRTIALVEISDGLPAPPRIVDTGPVPEDRALRLLGDGGHDRVVTTGYGRHLPLGDRPAGVISEIRAHAAGGRELFRDCRSIIDVGGQDVKAISLAPDGSVIRFEMNDRCAAGTGRFLENMARALEYTVEEFGDLALSAQSSVRINSLCTVFAESEAVSLLGRGAPAASVALALHEAAAQRVAALARRAGCQPPVVFCGGGALNRSLVALVQEALGADLLLPRHPQGVGALGAALHAQALLAAGPLAPG
jgi:predicted CoA-substrate-specific enzyme activase